MLRDILLGGLLLPFKLYFQPTAFADEVASLAPDLPRNYSLWRARDHLRQPSFRRGLGRIVLQATTALIWSMVGLAIISRMSVPIDWVGVAWGVTWGMAWGVAWVLTLGVAWGVTLGVAFGVAWGVAGGIDGSGIEVVAGGVTWSMTETMPGSVAWGVAWGVTLGVAWGVAWGVAVGLAVGLARDVAAGLAAGLASTHLWILPLQMLISAISALLIRLRPSLSLTLWHFSPVLWDEVILLPLPGLTGLLVALTREDPALGEQAIGFVAAHRFQRRAAAQALLHLAQEDAERASTLPAIGAVAGGMAWLSDQTLLPATSHAALQKLRDASVEVTAALESDSATNQVRRLARAQTLLAELQQAPGPLGRNPTRWAAIVATGLEEILARRQVEEPIPQIYITDGRPILPGDRPDTALPFKGRAALFRRLETALGGDSGERATLLLVGQRRAGKTSALLQLPRRLGSGVVPAFLDMQDARFAAESPAGLIRALALAIGEEARRHRGLALPSLDQGALAAEPYPALGRWLDRVEAALGDRTLLLCLDEFEALEGAIAGGRLDARLLATLRNIAQHRRRVIVLLAGSHHIDELPPHWAGALVTTTMLPISVLEEPDARALVTEPVVGFPNIYAAEAVDRIIRLTGCQPYLVQLLCSLLVERMNAARRQPPESYVTPADVEAIVPQALERGQAYFSDLWRVHSGGETGQAVLATLARAPEGRSRADLAAALGDSPALAPALRILLRRELIKRAGDETFAMTIPLVAAYVRQETI